MNPPECLLDALELREWVGVLARKHLERPVLAVVLLGLAQLRLPSVKKVLALERLPARVPVVLARLLAVVSLLEALAPEAVAALLHLAPHLALLDLLVLAPQLRPVQKDRPVAPTVGRVVAPPPLHRLVVGVLARAVVRPVGLKDLL